MTLHELRELVDRLDDEGYGRHVVFLGENDEAMPALGEIEMITCCLVCAESGEPCGSAGVECRNDPVGVVLIRWDYSGPGSLTLKRVVK